MLLISILLLGCVSFQPIPIDTVATPRSPQTISDLQADLVDRLLKAKRIYVESFGEDPVNKTLQSMLIDAIASTRRFIVTENKEKADLLLKGGALEKTSQELHSIGSATTVAGAEGHQSGSLTGTRGMVTGSSTGGFVARSLGIEDSQASTETINEAKIAVRLVSPDGDVVWSTTQESKGAKYKGAIADAADKAVKQLSRDIERLSLSRK